jgi:hypothetical protein
MVGNSPTTSKKTIYRVKHTLHVLLGFNNLPQEQSSAKANPFFVTN